MIVTKIFILSSLTERKKTFLFFFRIRFLKKFVRINLYLIKRVTHFFFFLFCFLNLHLDVFIRITWLRCELIYTGKPNDRIFFISQGFFSPSSAQMALRSFLFRFGNLFLASVNGLKHVIFSFLVLRASMFCFGAIYQVKKQNLKLL